jgi:hypothetical protein
MVRDYGRAKPLQTRSKMEKGKGWDFIIPF